MKSPFTKDSPKRRFWFSPPEGGDGYYLEIRAEQEEDLRHLQQTIKLAGGMLKEA